MTNHIEPRILMNQTVSGTTVATSQYLDSRLQIAGGFYISYGTGLSAAFSLQYSVDGMNYADSGVIIPAATGSAGSAMLNIFGIGINYIRIVVTPTSGSATVTVTGSLKG